MAADFELDFEEWLARFLCRRSRADRSCQEGVALALLLLARLLCLTLPARSRSLLGVLEHEISARRRQDRA